jgi:hypothetical protein
MGLAFNYRRLPGRPRYLSANVDVAVLVQNGHGLRWLARNVANCLSKRDINLTARDET